MLLAPRSRLGLRITVLVLVASIGILGIIAVATGAAGATSTLDIVPEYPLSIGLILSGIAMLAGAVFMFFSVVTSSPRLLVAAAVLTGLTAVGLLACGFSALNDSQMLYRLDASLEDRWKSAPNSARLSTQRQFGCCGFTSPADYYGPRWNTTCTIKGLDKKACCTGMLHWNTNATGFCEPAQPLYACCSSGLDSWPCYRLAPCYGVISAWLHSYTKTVSTFGLCGGFYAFFAVVLIGIGVFFIGRNDAKRGKAFVDEDDEDEMF